MTQAMIISGYSGDAEIDAVRALVTAAKSVATSVTVVALSSESETCNAYSLIAGVTRVLWAKAPTTRFDQEAVLSLARTVVREADPAVLLLSMSIRAAAIAPALAEGIGMGLVSDVVQLNREDDGQLIAVRPAYGGRVHVEWAFPPEQRVAALLRAEEWPPADMADSPAPVEETAAPIVSESRVHHITSVEPSGGVDLKSARVIFSAGRGIGSRENLEELVDVAGRLGVPVAATRPVVDAGWLPSAHQVGQTGLSVAPSLYVAFGISGAIQHLVGIRGAERVVALNIDPDAPIFQRADVGAVIDVNEVVAALRELS